MRKLWIFLKWFFGIRGSTKVHPAMAFKYLPRVGGIDPEAAETLAHAKLGSRYTELECVVCGCTYWSMKKINPSPVCTTWPCYRDFHLKELA